MEGPEFPPPPSWRTTRTVNTFSVKFRKVQRSLNACPSTASIGACKWTVISGATTPTEGHSASVHASQEEEEEDEVGAAVGVPKEEEGEEGEEEDEEEEEEGEIDTTRQYNRI